MFSAKSGGTVASFVDFNTQHVCRNFENVREWAEERQLPVEVPYGILEAPSEGYKKIP